MEPIDALERGRASYAARSWGDAYSALGQAEAERLLEAARSGYNRQLRFILSLLMLTGARPGEILNARWDQLDLAAGEAEALVEQECAGE